MVGFPLPTEPLLSLTLKQLLPQSWDMSLMAHSRFVFQDDISTRLGPT